MCCLLQTARLPTKFSLAFIVSLACVSLGEDRCTFRGILSTLDQAIAGFAPANVQNGNFVLLEEVVNAMFSHENPNLDGLTSELFTSPVKHIAAVLLCASPRHRALDESLVRLYRSPQVYHTLRTVFSLPAQ